MKKIKDDRPAPSRATILRIALEAQLDPRTVKRALDRGVDSLRSEYDRARLREAMKRLGHTDLEAR